jgi:hypothetical protein
MAIYKTSARWYRNFTKAFSCDADKLKKMCTWLIRNSFFSFGDQVFRQAIGIPMGTDAGPIIANMVLLKYEMDYILKMNLGRYDHCLKLAETYRLIDDITVINDDGKFDEAYEDIYPGFLQIKKINETTDKADVLDLHIEIEEGMFAVQLFDKRDSFNFNINSYPCIDGNVSRNMCYNCYGTALLRYSKIITRCHDFVKTTKALTDKLRQKGYSKRILFQTFVKTVNRNNIKELYNVQKPTKTFWLDILHA